MTETTTLETSSQTRADRPRGRLIPSKLCKPPEGCRVFECEISMPAELQWQQFYRSSCKQTHPAEPMLHLDHEHVPQPKQVERLLVVLSNRGVVLSSEEIASWMRENSLMDANPYLPGGMISMEGLLPQLHTHDYPYDYVSILSTEWGKLRYKVLLDHHNNKVCVLCPKDEQLDDHELFICSPMRW